MNRITPAMARAVLIGVRDRAKMMSRDKQVMSLCIGSFVNVLQAEPGLISYERVIGTGQYFPIFEGWRIELTDDTYEADFRAKVGEFQGSYLVRASSARQSLWRRCPALALANPPMIASPAHIEAGP